MRQKIFESHCMKMYESLKRSREMRDKKQKRGEIRFVNFQPENPLPLSGG